jgi:hypothetical protein
MSLEFWKNDRENSEILNVLKIPPVEFYLLHGERRTKGETDKRADIYDEGNCRFFQFLENILEMNINILENILKLKIVVES